MSTLRVSNIEAKADPSSPSVDEKLKVTNSNGDILVHIDGKTAGVTTVGINTTDRSFTVDAAQNVEFLGIVTATKFSLSGGGEITGGDGNFTGIVTAGSGDYSGGLSVGTAITAVSATFTGDVSIGGTLTYEDVTNIDSVGIITARSNIDAQSDVIVGAGLSVVGISTLANTNINGQLTATNARITGVTTFGTSSTTINGAHEYPSIRPTLDLNFAATKTLDRRITFTRDGVGTYVDDMGIIKYASNNTPRFDHDPTTGESLGLLIEEARTNNIDQSNAGNWSNTNITRGTNTSQDVSPEGLNTSTIITETTGDGLHRIKSPNISFTDTRTFSVWIKRNSGTRDLYINANAIMGAVLNFDFDTETLGSTTGTASFERYPNQWYRFILTGTGTGNTNGVYIQFTQSGNEGDDSYVGVTSNKFLVWGAQLEVGSFVTSHIPTSGSTVTRGQDFAIIKGTNFTDIFDTSFKQFSLLVDYDNSKTVDGTSYGIIDLWGESTGYDDRIEWFKDNESPYHIETRAFGQGNSTFVNGNLSASSKAKAQRFATSWYVPDYSNTSSRRFVMSMGGEAVDVVSDSSGTTVPQLTRMGIGCNPTRLDFSAGLTHFKKVVVYNKTLPDSQLQGLTAQ